ncbi:helix-turn-helix domain-containing protein [Phytohabitans suffuscus]|uniref:Transcriptional regulator n=1 Tax=Phytohabitans suffuscus TaxID=624315 RepID=A0A6F8YPM0_9ACTN|nr:helix-turn-helix transcriptional regulator [Phytohabitans suffuscus]BCB88072.1 transcriptional regulator [Phytohabitans suffuscus]
MPTKREQFVQTIRAQWLGQRMRELREERGLTLKYIAAYLGVEFSTLARYERAEWPFRRDHVVALLDVYGVYDERERAQLVQLAQDAWRVNRWDDDFEGTVYDQTFVDYPWLESRSEEICTYSTMVFPGLLQTRDYAESVIRYTEGMQANQQKIDRWVRLRMERQLILDEKPPKRLAALVEESVLHRPVGGRLVLRAQLEHLARAVERPHVELRVIPTRVGLQAGLSGSFTLFKMQRPYPEVAYVEHLGGRLFMEASRAHRYSKAYDALREVALSATESMALIATLAEELS